MAEAIAINRHTGSADVLNPIEVKDLNEFMASQYAERQAAEPTRQTVDAPVIGARIMENELAA